MGNAEKLRERDSSTTNNGSKFGVLTFSVAKKRKEKNTKNQYTNAK